MSEDSFYLQCPSNSSMNIFKDNTLARYSVNLDTPLELNDTYEVGLAELQYPQSWDNVRRGSNQFHIQFTYPQSGKWIRITKEVPTGYYASVPELIEVIKRIYRSTKKENVNLVGLVMTYNTSTRRVTINTDKMRIRIRRVDGKLHSPKGRQVIITLQDDVARLLGFQNGATVETGKSIESEFAATPSGGFHQMYLYTDIIHPQPHPDGNVPILRTIAVEGKPNQEYLSKRFQTIYYVSLLKHTITTISFEFRDDTS